MRRKNYAVFMALPGNIFSTEVAYGGWDAAKDADANLVVFPMGLIDNFRYDIETFLYSYQYNVLGSFIGNNSLDAGILEYGTITGLTDEDKKKHLLGQNKDKPVVLVAAEREGYPGVIFDNKTGIRNLVRHFATEHHCTRIAFLSGTKGNPDAQERLAAYRETMEEVGLPVDESLIEYGIFAYEVKEEIEALFGRHPDIEALICANDDMAMGACDILTGEYGKVIGRDILISGFDDQPRASLMNPPLTTVRADARKLAERAMRIAMDAAGTDGKAGEIEPVTYKVDTEMVLRESCGCNSERSTKSTVDALNADRTLMETQLMDRVFLGEIEMLMREAIYYLDTDNEWLKAILNSFSRLGYSRCFLFQYDEPVVNQDYIGWKQPEYLNLLGQMNQGVYDCYEMGTRRYLAEELFNLDFIQKEERSDLIVLPLFFREKQLGLIVADGPVDNIRYAFELGSMVSNAFEMVQVQQTNMRLMKELEEASRAKSQFLANMSHEIRTPINAIMGMNEMIGKECGRVHEVQSYEKNGDLMRRSVERVKECSTDIEAASQTLLSIVNDILDLSRIESNKLTIIPVEYKLSEMVQSIFKQVGFKQRSKDVELRLEMDENLPAVLLGDDLRIEQVLLNLLSNAVKYTQKGEVLLKVNGSTEENEAVLTFAVKDTGIGIKEEDIGRLFEEFERIEEKRNRSIEGSGLGMSITVSLLSMMNSRLQVESTYGEGSEFSFVLRQKIVDATPVKDYHLLEQESRYAQADTADFDGKRILVVDDNDINRKVIVYMLEDLGMTIEEACDGAECLKMVEQADYDLILLDHMMPVMDGKETLKRLQERPSYEKGRPAVVVLTANAVIGAEQEYLDAGFDAYLSKPVGMDRLMDVLKRFLK